MKTLEEDFLTGSYDSKGTYLFWVTDTFALARVKSALSAKTIFKFRMRFFADVDAYNWFITRNMRKHAFTAKQEQMFRELN